MHSRLGLGAWGIGHFFLVVTLLLTPLSWNSEWFGMHEGEPVSASGIRGPIFKVGYGPEIFDGDVRNLPQSDSLESTAPAPLRYLPGQEPKGSAPQLVDWVDSVAQENFLSGEMPSPLANFAGLDFLSWGSGYPPDTNGDVSETHYIQSVNTSIGIFSKSTGARLAAFTFNDFFSGPAGTPCDSQNRGDPVVLYDPYVQRWVITDFAWADFDNGPFYECIAVSQSSDPVSGGWYFYALEADAGLSSAYLNDYPKLGVWPDGWYMSANMFRRPDYGDFFVRVWALDKTSMVAGGPINQVVFDCVDLRCASLLPSNLRGNLPPPGAPNYFAAVGAPDQFYLWKFDVDWGNPLNSTFTGPVALTVAEFALASSIPQPGTSLLLDSLSFRLMMQLQYRYAGGVEALWATHSVASGGVTGVRWYEVRDPNGAPVVFQQGTYQPDAQHRWMGSLAVDQDGNMAVGYSVSSAALYPSIRYAGRLAGEIPGLLPQNEASLMVGAGSQLTSQRWGDYSTMTVDPLDDCTFWYTSEYYSASGGNWQTRIGSFKFPSCGAAKAYLAGTVRNSITGAAVPGAPVIASSPLMTMTVETDASGAYSMTLTAGVYTLTAGPLPPGFLLPAEISGVTVLAGQTTLQDVDLTPVPSLVTSAAVVDDSGAFGNNNGYLEPGESAVAYYQSLLNQGAVTSTLVSASLHSLTAGLVVDTAAAAYPDIPVEQARANLTPFSLSLSNQVACGTELALQEVVSDSVRVYELPLTLNASVPLARNNAFYNDVEAGAAGWSSAGINNTWAITTLAAHSPSHSWTDSPAGEYLDNTNAYLRTPAYDLSGKRKVQLDGWFKYGLEPGYDYVYLEYSLNGGLTWEAQPLYAFNGYQPDWKLLTVDASVLDDQPNVALRFHLVSDAGVTDEGIYIDDVALSYEPYECTYAEQSLPAAPTLTSPLDGELLANPVAFSWQPSIYGGLPLGYVLTIDSTDVVTTAVGTTSVLLDVPAGAHAWTVRAYNGAGQGPMAEPRTLNGYFTMRFPVIFKK